MKEKLQNPVRDGMGALGILITSPPLVHVPSLEEAVIVLMDSVAAIFLTFSRRRMRRLAKAIMVKRATTTESYCVWIHGTRPLTPDSIKSIKLKKCANRCFRGRPLLITDLLIAVVVTQVIAE